MKVTFLRKKIDIAICPKNLIFSLVFNKPLSSNKLNNIKIAATRISVIRNLSIRIFNAESQRFAEAQRKNRFEQHRLCILGIRNKKKCFRILLFSATLKLKMRLSSRSLRI